ncbi:MULTISPECIES: aminotransferase class III-fold pyridoxal phosphate-dependent enzyme [unclassified Thermosynechococcus]|uniref:aminotransferase class III-fold pyridoxal phosphate-dependent enzyme n=1 Tax=unclassified Thermosynechococcus TaxID=2622553 RepID=UPI00287748BB|nr:MULTISPECIES: aminotransferase class III-fold pyridoxal phosphate-dependent enzyme [unclassified Thermosynechococcus]WNC52870.1 aminotransferase class III-fold pyridoxal phosphate-dependent enzyme [Thermosynechococcus sp. TG215]WNC57961.1 aminotransferase class III-fold pyridoxal phosphate-dependent enzyme [Thermosynechococcus sp. TG218]
MKIAIVQARMGSTRLPGKVMLKADGRPLIYFLLQRLRNTKLVDQIVVATGSQPENQKIVDYVHGLGFCCEQGSEKDVLDRYYQVAKKYGAKTVIRVTADCPLIDPEIVDQVIDLFQSSSADYCATSTRFADGLDVEVFTFQALETAWQAAYLPFDREHVSPYIRNSGKFRLRFLEPPIDLSSCRWTVDEPEDYQIVRQVIEHFAPRIDFSWREIWQMQQEYPAAFSLNEHIGRNEGAILGTGQKLWKRAKRIIPGGSMLLSKRAEMFLPEYWPSYFSKAKGCRIWDLDDREYIDMSMMGIGTNTLGYAHPEVDEAVQQVIAKGNLSTLNCPEEVYLAEKLIELHPWADMVRFARTGGEANAIAIRIARAATGKDSVAICGYHGWHDWYLAANLGDEQTLATHLLPGLEPKGIPSGLKGTVFPFHYNQFDELEALVNQHDIGVIKMEVQRNEPPKDGFLAKVRKLATDRGIVLIFDECTSGFRQALGGLHKIYGVEPDMAVFGKALGNGYAITAVVGRREVMTAAQSTFISSTFWTERIGPTAGLKTLEVMDKTRSWERITQTGRNIAELWQQLAVKHQLALRISGIPALIRFQFENTTNNLAYKTLITQEMLARGYLATNAVYVCTEHTPEIIQGYGQALDEVFGLIKECEEGRDVKTLLKGSICHAEMRRLN